VFGGVGRETYSPGTIYWLNCDEIDCNKKINHARNMGKPIFGPTLQNIEIKEKIDFIVGNMAQIITKNRS
jgi:hypothetical protein